MINIKECYFHSIIDDDKKTLETFKKILQDDKILSVSESGIENDNMRMNQDDEICLSKKSKMSLRFLSAYDCYVKNNLTFIIKGNLPCVYKPELIKTRNYSGNLDRYVKSGLTDLYDEYRVKNEIPLDYVIGINFPVNNIVNTKYGYNIFFRQQIFDDYIRQRDKKVEASLVFYDKLLSIMEDNKRKFRIYDLANKSEITSRDDIAKMKTKQKLFF